MKNWSLKYLVPLLPFIVACTMKYKGKRQNLCDTAEN